MKKHNLLVATMTIAAFSPALVWAQQQSEPYRYGHGPHMMGWGWGGGWFGMILGPIFMILVLAVVIAVAVLLVRWLGGQWHGAQSPNHMQQDRMPLDILKERYARGEIDSKEFDERRKVLGD